MKQKMGQLLIVSSLLLSGCVNANQSSESSEGNANERTHPMSMMGDRNRMHMSHDNVVALNNSTGERELAIPPLLEPEKGSTLVYTIRAQTGETALFDGAKTKTYGYNGEFLGPVIRLPKGEQVTLRTVNELQEETTFHWHGLEVPGEADGGPHAVLLPGETEDVTFKVMQEAATLWFHPHPIGKTAKQVYNGLAGLIYIEDEQSKRLSIPNDYGKNDFPLIIQDRMIDPNNQFNYEAAMNPDGTIGNTTLINGTYNPKLTIDKGLVRLRLLNGSNARNYTFALNTGDSFYQVATDGGLLNKPKKIENLTLTPSERAEIVIDFSRVQSTEDIQLINEQDGSILLPFKLQGQSKTMVDSKILSEQLNDFEVTDEEKKLPVTKEIELFGMMHHVTINGKKFDPNRIDFTQKQGETEIWEVYNKPDPMGGMIHPFHIHGTQFKIVSRNGKAPTEEEKGWKDSVSLDPGDRVKLAVKFDHLGVYMFHCHILEHEENGMMGQVEVI